MQTQYCLSCKKGIIPGGKMGECRGSAGKRRLAAECVQTCEHLEFLVFFYVFLEAFHGLQVAEQRVARPVRFDLLRRQ